MGIYRPWVRHDIAPSDDLAGRDCDQLRVAMLDIVEDEGPRRFERWGFQKREISPFARHKVERPVIASI